MNVGEMVAETRRHLLASTRDELNRLNGAITNVATTATMEFSMGSIQRGALLAIEFELLYVWDIAAQVATVQRGMDGSTAAAHADDTLVRVNPRFSDFAILAALNAEILSYSSPLHGLYRIVTDTITWSPGTYGYELDATMTDVIDVRTTTAGINGDNPRIRHWEVIRHVGDFASGIGIELEQGLTGQTVTVIGKGGYTALPATYATDAATASGLHLEAHDIPPLGAAARLMAGREARRAQYDAQPEPRAAAEVPPGTNRSAAADLLALRRMRINEEKARLVARYPILSRL